MTSLPEGLSVAGVHVIPADGDPSTFYYFPVRPRVAADFRGNPEFAWVEPLSLLNVTTRLEVDAAVEETIRGAERLARGRFRLVPAPLSVTRVSLLLQPPGAAPRPVGEGSASSGLPPFQAAHGARLAPADAAVVQAAIREGRELPVWAVYEGVLHLPRTAEVTCSVVGDVTADVEALAGGAVAPDAARARVEAAIAEGRLQKETTVAGAPPPSLRGDVEDEAVRGAAGIVRALAEAHAAAQGPASRAAGHGVEPEPAPESGPEPLPFGALGAVLFGSDVHHVHHGSSSRTRTTSSTESTSGTAVSGGAGPHSTGQAGPGGPWVLRAEAGNIHTRRVTDTQEIEVRCAGPLGLRVGTAR